MLRSWEELEAAITDWGERWIADPPTSQIQDLQKLFFELGMNCESPVYIGSQETQEFRYLKNNHPRSIFNPEAYGISTDPRPKPKYPIKKEGMYDINASFIMGVIAGDRDVVCNAYLGHPFYLRYFEVSRNQNSEERLNGTIGEVILLLNANYGYNLETSENYFRDDIDWLSKGFLARNITEDERVTRTRASKRLIHFSPQQNHIGSPDDNVRRFSTCQEANQHFQTLKALKSEQRVEVAKIFGAR